MDNNSIDNSIDNSIAQSILDIFTQFALNKFKDSSRRLLAGTPTFLALITTFVQARQPVQACLPSFPFKSANKEYKVLGPLPDKAEELALRRLEAICHRIRQIYPPGANITIISDGLTYNDLLSISDRETWQYGQALRHMALSNHLTCISFARIKDLVACGDAAAGEVDDLPDQLREITYVANCTNLRRALLNQHLCRPPPDINREIALHPDTKLTYLGYCRFLESDLKHIFPPDRERTNRAYKRDVKFLAKEMLKRGYAFAAAIRKAFPNHLRLSIHESVGEHKLSISLLNTHTGFTTPWHCSVAQLLTGDWISAPAAEFRNDDRFELVHHDGRPSHFREKPKSSSSSLAKTMTLVTQDSLDPSSSDPSSVGVGADIGLDGCPTPVDSPCSSDGQVPSIVRSGTATPDSNRVPDFSVPYGKRLLPQIIDNLAESHPDQIVYSLLSSSKSSNGTIVSDNQYALLDCREISASQLARAIDKTAWWLETQVGRPAHIQPIGYIGPHDLRHVLLTYACAKVGYAALFLSPKSSTQAALAVVDALDCRIWAVAGDAAPVALVNDMLARCPIKVLQLPLLDSLINSNNDENHDATASKHPHPPYPYTKAFAQAATEPFCYLHTSGNPKPIPWSHGLIGTMDAIRLLPPVNVQGSGQSDDLLVPWTTDWKPGDRIYSAFPMSHGTGIIMNILMPALYNLHCVMGPANVLPSTSMVEVLADQVSVDIWSLVPSLVDEIGETPRVLAKLAPSKFICASGGPVSPVSASKANKVIRVLNLTGTTEGLFIGNLVVPRDDWFWFAFHPYAGFEFKKLHQDTYQHWIHRDQRKQHASLFQGIFHTFPDEQSINFHDLYTRHPSKPHLWAFKGRSDDLVVLSDGYKILPLETEALISAHPDINDCLVIGAGKTRVNRTVAKANSENQSADDAVASAAQMKRLLAQHQARRPFKLNAMDYVNPNHYMGLVFYFPLADGVCFRDAFKMLSQGLDRTMDLIPALGGKIMPCSEHEIGYTKGDLCVTIPPAHLASWAHNRLIFKDLSETLPSFRDMEHKDFVPSLFRDELVLPQDTFPQLPADIVIAQANFVKGGCILAVNMNHCCMDGMGAMIALKAWAENCRSLQGDTAATCSWLDPDCFNHDLPEVIHAQQGWSKPVDTIDPGTWGFLPFQPAQDQRPYGHIAKSGGDLPPAPKYKLHSAWPLPRAERCMNTTVFKISATNVEKLKRQVLQDPAIRGSTPSASDTVQAFLWRSAIRARRHVAKAKGQVDPELNEDMSILESPTDGRACFSPLLPSTYMGSMLIMSRSTLSTEELCARETSFGRIAQVLRNTAALMTPSLMHDALTLLQSLPDHTRFSTANMGLHHMHVMISNLILFQSSEINFGDKLFGNKGSPEAMRPQLVRSNGRFRFLIISPPKKDGAVELVLGTFPEELEFLKTDQEFNEYAELVDISPW